MRLFLLLSYIFNVLRGEIDDTFNPTKCETCALVAMEFNHQASRIHKRVSSEFAELIENFCFGFNKFYVHKEKTGLARFSNEPSKTMTTLRQMRNKGVKVELGMPEELWDQPSAEIVVLRQGCELIVENFEDLMESWFLERKSLNDLMISVCKMGALRYENTDCLPMGSGRNEL
ncbi:unnamed protein product [Caenorhabditis sp. 36 PRJEB53466]|nr:unnamed protein product [Caenorhabditis sp. 36 PRJEB53466]